MIASIEVIMCDGASQCND